MKKYEEPILEVEKLEVEDVINTSCTADGGDNNCGSNACPFD